MIRPILALLEIYRSCTSAAPSQTRSYSKKNPPNLPTKAQNSKCKLRTSCNGKPDCELEKQFVSMWEPPKNLPEPYPFLRPELSNQCCGPACSKPLPRFDEMFYRPSCLNKKFQRTWIECPAPKQRPRKICSFDELSISLSAQRDIQKRERKTSSPVNNCLKDSKLKACPLFAALAGCKPARRPAKCFSGRQPTCCSKLCAPQPCWSECKRPELKLPRLPPPECFCPTPVSPCQVLAHREWIKQHGAVMVCSKPNKCPGGKK